MAAMHVFFINGMKCLWQVISYVARHGIHSFEAEWCFPARWDFLFVDECHYAGVAGPIAGIVGANDDQIFAE